MARGPHKGSANLTIFWTFGSDYTSTPFTRPNQVKLKNLPNPTYIPLLDTPKQKSMKMGVPVLFSRQKILQSSIIYVSVQDKALKLLLNPRVSSYNMEILGRIAFFRCIARSSR